MKVIIPIIKSMSPAELENVKRGLMQFSTKRPKKSEPDNGASLKLIEAVKKHGYNYTEEDYCLLMYGRNRDPKFRALKFWLKRRLNELRIAEVCLNHNPNVRLTYHHKIQVKKYLAEAYLYYSQENGEYVQAYLFEQIIKIGEKYELFDDLGEVYSIMYFSPSYNSDPVKIKVIEKKLRYYRKCQAAIDRIYEIYNFRNSLAKHEKNLSPSREKAILKDALDELKMLSEGITSLKFNYFYLCLVYDYHLASRNIRKAIQVAEEILVLVQTNTFIGDKERIGKTYGYLCTCALHLRDYKQVLQYVQKLKGYLNAGTSNMKFALLHELQAQIHLGQYDAAETTLTKLRSEPIFNEDKRDTGQYDYFQSIIHFLKGNYSECFSILQSIRDITDDKAGWNIGVRQLCFMCLVEMELYQQASATVEQMRKYIDRTKAKVEFRERDRVIYSLFAALNRADFDFNHTKSTMPKLVSRLSDDDGDISWQSVSQELVPVHTWFLKHQEATLRKRKLKKNADRMT